MRAVDLTPTEERGGGRGPTRTGNLPYVLLAGLALALIGVAVLALTSKQISDNKDEVATLQQDLTAAEAKANELRPFADFRAMQESRTSTVRALAQSRFDWERVIQELSLVIPSDIWLINITGSVTPDVSVTDGAEITARDAVAGPALELIGCAPSQDSVATFVAALEDIDGVTRVGVTSSERPEPESVSSGPTEGQDDCRTRDFISQFEIVIAFDAVPAPAGAVAPPPSVPAPTAGTPEQQQQLASAGQQTSEARQAADTFIPGG